MKMLAGYVVTKPNLTRLLEAVVVINERFCSGNSVPIEKASVPVAEWEAVRVALIAAFPEVFVGAKERAKTPV